VIFRSTSSVRLNNPEAGQILDIAGWSDTALYSVQLLTPDAPQGVPVTTDWQKVLNTSPST
jgi:hypothetical protein